METRLTRVCYWPVLMETHFTRVRYLLASADGNSFYERVLLTDWPVLMETHLTRVRYLLASADGNSLYARASLASAGRKLVLRACVTGHYWWKKITFNNKHTNNEYSKAPRLGISE